MVADLSGVLCDGAKDTCALKIFSCLNAAVMSVRLAVKGIAPGSSSGIVGVSADDTIQNLMRISHEGMEQTDHTILSIMLGKEGGQPKESRIP